MVKKLLTGIFAALCAASAVALDTATIRITMPDGKVSTRQVKAERPAENPDGGDVRRVKIPVREIPRGALYLDVVADAAKAKKGEAGWYVLADGSLVEFTQDSGKYSCRRRMPLFGFKTPRGSAAVVVKGLGLEFEPTAEASGGNYEVFPRFKIKEIHCDPYEDIIVDFYKLGDGASYVDVGKVYRNYQLSRGEVRPLAERVKDSKSLKKAADSIYVRVKFSTRVRRGVPYSEWAKIPMTVQYTFEDGRKILDRIKKAGMDDVEFCFVGWQKGGHDGPYPDLFPIPQELGGERAWLRLSISAKNSASK